jgi:hypothetical protein
MQNAQIDSLEQFTLRSEPSSLMIENPA